MNVLEDISFCIISDRFYVHHLAKGILTRAAQSEGYFPDLAFVISSNRN